MKIPEGAQYQYAWSYFLGDEKPLNSSPQKVRVLDGRQVNLTVYSQNNASPRLGIRTDEDTTSFAISANNGITIPAKTAFAFKQFGAFQRPQNFSHVWKYNNDFATVSRNLGETICLLRIQGNDLQTGETLGSN